MTIMKMMMTVTTSSVTMMTMIMSVSVCVILSLSVSFCTRVFFSVSVYVCLSVCLSVSVSVSVSVSLSLSPFICLSPSFSPPLTPASSFFLPSLPLSVSHTPSLPLTTPALPPPPPPFPPRSLSLTFLSPTHHKTMYMALLQKKYDSLEADLRPKVEWRCLWTVVGAVFAVVVGHPPTLVSSVVSWASTGQYGGGIGGGGEVKRGLFVGWLLNVPAASSLSQGRICSDNFYVLAH